MFYDYIQAYYVHEMIILLFLSSKRLYIIIYCKKRRSICLIKKCRVNFWDVRK